MSALGLLLLAGQLTAGSADIETLILQIAEKRIVHEALRDGLAVDVGGPGAEIDVSIGVVITAEGLEVYLRRVDGVVRYRLRPDKVLEPIRARAK